jgi:hypothetical protein
MSDFSYLYIISEGPEGPVKIGRSNLPRARLSTLQTGNARPLELIDTYILPIDQVGDAERTLHEELADHSIIGEWFNLSVRFMRAYMPDFFLSNGFEVVNGSHQNH